MKTVETPHSSVPASYLTEKHLADHLSAWLEQHGESLVRLRRYIHAHPELSGAEHATAALIAERLTAAGLDPQFLPDGNGLMCDIGDGDRVIALRADMDALPLPDPKDVSYRSTVEGACHACGHDVHTTVLLGVALALTEIKDVLPGRIRFIFQPAEEIGAGAHQAIAAGFLTDVAEIYTVHCNPQLPAGKVGLRVGPITSACDQVRVVLSGPGGHTARPHLTADLVSALGKVVSEVPTLLARKVDPRAGLVAVFGAVNAGATANVIPQNGSALGTVRMLDPEVWERVPALFEQVVRDVVAPYGVTVEIEYDRYIAPVVNDEHAVSVFSSAASKMLGPDAVAPTPQSAGGEDFSWYLQHVPGAMARLGVGGPGENADIHQGEFDVDEYAIECGVRLLAGTAIEALRR